MLHSVVLLQITVLVAHYSSEHYSCDDLRWGVNDACWYSVWPSLFSVWWQFYAVS